MLCNDDYQKFSVLEALLRERRKILDFFNELSGTNAANAKKRAVSYYDDKICDEARKIVGEADSL